METIKRRRGRPKKVVVKDYAQCEIDFTGMQRLIEKSDIAGQIQVMLEIVRNNKQEKQWRGMIAVPPTSLLELIIKEFREKTNIPLEIPFFVFLSLLSGILLHKKIKLKIGEDRCVTPNLWTILLAESGAGKTFVSKTIEKSIKDKDKILFQGTGIVSAAAFVSELSEKNNKLWIRDEFAQFLRAIESPTGPLSEMKDYCLRLYDHDRLERKTKKDVITVEEPSLSILGLNALGSFHKYVTAEMMMDGFSQRFQYVVARRDPERPMEKYLDWDVSTKGWDERWQSIQSCLQQEYTATSELASTAVLSSFRVCFSGLGTLDESFVRRIIWAAHPYALLYHVLRRPEETRLVAEDYGWAGRLLSMHVADLSYLIGEHNLSVVEKMVRSVEAIRQQVRAKDNREITPRDIVRGIRNIKTTQQAMSLLQFAVNYGAEKTT